MPRRSLRSTVDVIKHARGLPHARPPASRRPEGRSGDLPGALTLWNDVAADSAADPLLRDLASLMAAQRQLDGGDPAQLAARLQPLAQPGNPWAALAKEQLALLDLRQSKTEDAKAKLHALSINIGAPSGVRARAAALLAGLG